MAYLRICDVCRSTEPKPEWIYIQLHVRREKVESHQNFDYCSYDCYLRALEGQIHIILELKKESSQ